MRHNENSAIPARFIPSPRVVDALEKISVTHGPVVLVQEAARIAEAGPTLKAQDSRDVLPDDVFLGTIDLRDGQVPFYVDANAFATWWDHCMEIDIVEIPQQYTPEGPEALRLTASPRRLTEAEICHVVAAGPPLRGKRH